MVPSLAALVRRPDFDWSRPRVFRRAELHPGTGKEPRGPADLLFSREKLLGIDDELQYGRDLRVCRVGVEGRREEFGHEGCCTRKALKTHFQRGRTVQLFSPQRFVDSLWSLQADLEAELQCLVGASCYMTPPGSQGLAPHWDDVDVFVIQCEGTKHWVVHEPLKTMVDIICVPYIIRILYIIRSPTTFREPLPITT